MPTISDNTEHAPGTLLRIQRSPVLPHVPMPPSPTSFDTTKRVRRDTIASRTHRKPPITSVAIMFVTVPSCQNTVVCRSQFSKTTARWFSLYCPLLYRQIELFHDSQHVDTSFLSQTLSTNGETAPERKKSNMLVKGIGNDAFHCSIQGAQSVNLPATRYLGNNG